MWKARHSCASFPQLIQSVSNVHFYLYNLKNFQKQISILTQLLCHFQPDSNLSAGNTFFDWVTSDLHYHVRSWLWQKDTRKACITKNRWRQAVSLSKACHTSFCSNVSSGTFRRNSKIRMICIVVWLMSPSLSVQQDFEHCMVDVMKRCIVSFRSLNNVPWFQRNTVYLIKENKWK